MQWGLKVLHPLSTSSSETAAAEIFQSGGGGTRRPAAAGEAAFGLRRIGLSALAWVMVWGLAMGALLGSEPLANWAEQTPSSPEWSVGVLHEWNAAMVRFGTTGIYKQVRTTVERLRGQ